MRIQKLLKPFLAASTLGTCAYYFNHKTKSLFLRECLEENKQTSFLINRNKDLSSPLKKEKISSDNSISDNKLLPIKDKVITPYEENKLHNIIMLVNEKTTSDVEGYHKLFWRLSGEYLEAYKNQTDSEMLMRLAVIYEIGSAAYVFYKDHVENVERAFELCFGAYILRIKGGGHNHQDTKESRKILIAKYLCTVAGQEVQTIDGLILISVSSLKLTNDFLFTIYKTG